jgi:NADH-ubiquinone oxidoreductase chain 5
MIWFTLSSGCYYVKFQWICHDFFVFVLYGLRFIISSSVILHRDDYTRDDLNINRFILFVLIFVLSMMFLIIRPNIIRIVLGWDGLGLVSYCLVIY